MARDLSSRCKKCRRAGEKLFLKGDRCTSPKCAMVRKAYPPGVHGKRAFRGNSEYGKQLAMKQKIKRMYGIMESQFRKHFNEVKNKPGITGDLFISRLEMRLDNVVYRLGFADSRSLTRQLVMHGHFLVNGKKVNIPSYEVKIGDEISLAKTKEGKRYFINRKMILKNKKDFPAWIQFNKEKYTGKIIGLPERHEAGGNIDPQLIVEFYSR